MLDPAMRASDSDRDAVSGVLRNAEADGRLDAAELADRLDALGRARTYSDLDDVVRDLTSTLPSEFLDPSPTDPEPARVGSVPEHLIGSPGFTPEDPLIFDAGWGTQRRVGGWTLPPFISVRGGAGTVFLDCCSAQTVSEVISVDVAGGMGDIKFVIPVGWGVDTLRVGRGMGTVSEKTAGHTPGMPTLAFFGHMTLGSLTIRTPNWFDRRRHRKIQKQNPMLTASSSPSELPSVSPNDLR
ncbi:DUF1707 SHOCT-like domain-containing protein [Propioniferax innocua]|uniref:Uncharacterized protein DUF1707 n=1 Tax=Propioniferax innocua TaxID=1753 RepID=A0A542Z7G0_9ACTN|nr:DUF1707 domain-containing protein [Propioniferax innocua]TQL56268.1 uncharacterized protein DUF1707 [Propioniferax innocua]